MTLEQRQYNGATIVSATTGQPYRKMNKNTDLTPFTKIDSKWIVDLSVKHKTIQLLEDNKRENQADLGNGDDTAPKTQTTKKKNT